MAAKGSLEIVDIRDSKDSVGSTPHLRLEIVNGLMKPPGQRTLPPELLYDEVGLKIYNETLNDWSKWYYPLLAETEILQMHGRAIAEQLKMSEGGQAIIVELGAGSLEKTAHILLSLASLLEDNLETAPVTYYALDLDWNELNRTLSTLQARVGHQLKNKIATKGMWGTYDDGIQTLSRNELKLHPDIPVHLLFLGGTIGNFRRGADSEFLRSLPLRHQAGDTLIMGIDKAKSVEALEFAYGFDAATPWIMNGLRSAGMALCEKQDFFRLEDWERYKKYNEKLGRYEAGYKARRDISIRLPDGECSEIVIAKGEVILIMFSNKYTDDEIELLLRNSSLSRRHTWTDTKKQYYVLSVQPIPTS